MWDPKVCPEECEKQDRNQRCRRLSLSLGSWRGCASWRRAGKIWAGVETGVRWGFYEAQKSGKRS
jgi:hypothetical protein